MNDFSPQMAPSPNVISEKFAQAEVLTINWGESGTFGKKLQLRYPDQPDSRVIFQVPRSACVTKGDKVYSHYPLDVNASMEKDHLFIQCHNGFAQLTPIYSVETTLYAGALALPVTIKEITRQDEFEGYQALTRYHYRDKRLFGRHAPLIAVTSHPMLPKVLGYIDLTTAFFVNSPRKAILDEPTRLNGVGWDRWTTEVNKDRIPLFVRIARCVVHPELRSVGLGKILVSHAAKFAKRHWQSAHWQPYFLEISADMLRYIPFAEKAEMTFVGETKGNLKRIAQDIKYLKKNEARIQKEILQGEVVSIVDTQLSQFQKANTIIINRLEEQNIGDFIADQIKNPTLDGWAKLTGIVSFPKPHYMMGLNEEADELIANRVQTLDVPSSPAGESQAYNGDVYKTRLQQPLKIENLTYQVKLNIPRTEITHQIERAFEIPLDSLVQPILKNLSFEILPGEIFVVTGLSGTGKTSLLHLLANKSLPTEGKIIRPENIKIGTLNPISVSKPLIEVISRKDTGKGLYWMGVVGLSEPYLYVKPFSALSSGQKYRAMLARLLIKGANFWLIDEFCENLDVVNTNLLSRKIAILAKKVGATVVIASSDANRFVQSLRPDKVLVLRGVTDTNGYELLSGDDFIFQIIGEKPSLLGGIT